MRWILKGLGILVGLLVVLVGVLGVNTLRYQPPETADTVVPFVLGADIAQATTQLSQAITFETDSTQQDHPDFDRFQDFLRAEFPLVHAGLARTLHTRKTPLFLWEGSDPAAAPVLLAAHYDVVPIAPGSHDRWDHPPYSGAIADGFVWGRGTLDNKGALIAILTAVETLLDQGFQPKRSVYLSFGGDEEVGGFGAYAVAKSLRDAGITLEWALDEGSFVLDRIIPGLDVPVASINLAEKGYVTLKLIAQAPGGHSSLPPNQTAVGRLARAVDRVQSAPVPGGLSGVSASFFDTLGRYFTLDKRVIFANRWLFGPVLESTLSAAPSTNAMLRTTTAPTMLTGSPKENVLATQATAVINFRLHPRDTPEDIIAHVTKVIDDPEVAIETMGRASPASAVSASDTQGYADIADAIAQSFGATATVPGLTIAATDARHYARAATSAYRINPFKITGDDLSRFHGTNERLSIENLERGINFYGALLRKQ